MSTSCIKLALQIVNGMRIELAGEWSPSSSLAEVMKGVSLSSTSDREIPVLRYLNRKVSQSEWRSMTLRDIGLTGSNGGRALLLLECNNTDGNSNTAALSFRSGGELDAGKRSLNHAIEMILHNNFDVDTKACFVTFIKILDNILQQPGNEKTRSIRLSNPAFHEKVGQRTGGGTFPFLVNV